MTNSVKLTEEWHTLKVLVKPKNSSVTEQQIYLKLGELFGDGTVVCNLVLKKG